MVKYLLTIMLFIVTAGPLAAQAYSIQDETQRINNKKYPGASSLVNAEFDKVEDFWLDYIKDHGKVRRKRNYYQINELAVKDLASDTLTYVTRVDAKDSLGLIWLAPLVTGVSQKDLQALNDDIKKILKLATRAYYVSVVQKRIDQSEDAAVVMSKTHQKLLYEGEKLTHDLVAAEELKAELEARLQETILKIKVLNQQIEDNKAAVEQAYADLEKIKKVIDGHKESLKKIK